METHTQIFSKDVTLWSDDSAVKEKIDNRLGWLDAPAFSRDNIDVFYRLKERVQASNFQHVVLLGMGGSSLAAEVFQQLLPANQQFMTMHVLDSTNPVAIKNTLEQVVLAETLFIVASKSGGTLETSCLFEYFYDQVKKQITDAGQHFLAITDPGSALISIAEDHVFFDCLINPADIGGRYSALSYFGLVPALLLGWDIDKLISKAEQAVNEDKAGEGLGCQLGKWFSEVYDNPTHVLNFQIEDKRLKSFFLWIEQLVAESLGKQGQGVLPALNTVSTAPSTLTAHMKFSDSAHDIGGDTSHINLQDEYDLAAQFFHWEIATAIAAVHIRINPFDEPNVTEAKQKTNQLLSTGEKIKIPVMTSPIEDFMSNIESPEYIALLIYTHNSETNASKAQQLKKKLESEFNLPVTINIGPRYLHSVGQLHKGGKTHGAFLVLVDKPNIDIDIPEKDHSFEQLFYAQALGDWQILQEKDLPSAIYELDKFSELAFNF